LAGIAAKNSTPRMIASVTRIESMVGPTVLTNPAEQGKFPDEL
jgi:hypothetical protein